MSDNGYGVTIFPPEVPPAARTRKIVFFVILSVIVLVQCSYWLFANTVEPIIFGMPFGMFFVVLFILLEFIALLVLYLLEADEYES